MVQRDGGAATVHLHEGTIVPEVQKAGAPVPERSERQEPTEDQPSRRVTKLTEVVAAWVRQQPPPGPHPDIASKVTSEHVSQSLEMVEAHDRRLLEDRKDQRTHALRQNVIVAAAVVGSIAMLVFSENAPLLSDILRWAVPLAAGVVGGAGWVKRRG